MKKRVLFFQVLIIVTLFSSMVWGQGAMAPDMFFKENTFSAGEVLEGALIDHTYTVYNRGNTVLNINSVRPG